jgi:hypothetical protein
LKYILLHKKIPALSLPGLFKIYEKKPGGFLFHYINDFEIVSRFNEGMIKR